MIMIINACMNEECLDMRSLYGHSNMSQNGYMQSCIYKRHAD